MAVDPKLELTRGALALQAVLGPAGFIFAIQSEGSSSGGPYCAGTFTRDDRRLELHVRGSLGLVTYSIGSETISHEDYVRTLGARGEYPGFSQHIEEAFIHLRSDLESVGTIFLTGSDLEFLNLIRLSRENPQQKGFRALGEPK